MFENKDYIAVSVPDDLVRKRSLKRVRTRNSCPFSDVIKIVLSFLAMEFAFKISKEPHRTDNSWRHLTRWIPHSSRSKATSR